MAELEREISPPKDEREAEEVADFVAKILSGYFNFLRRGSSFLCYFPGFELEMVRVVRVKGGPVGAVTILAL